MSKIVNLKSLSFETILFKINKIEREEPTKIGYQKILNFLDSTESIFISANLINNFNNFKERYTRRMESI
jgi:hypothetical protein